MTHASLFSGIGGFDLAAEWVGWRNVFQVELNPYCRKVLHKNFPNVQLYGDIKKFKAKQYRGAIGVLSGGDPCQPHSVAGLARGAADVRYLWPEMLRIIQDVEPPWLVNENVNASITDGVFDGKALDLERLGYEVQAYSIPAESVGALHNRERLWLLAYNGKTTGKEPVALAKERQAPLRLFAPDPDGQRRQKLHVSAEPADEPQGVRGYFGFSANAHGNFTRHKIKSAVVGMLTGVPPGLDYPNRTQRIKALGNAVVPQVVFELFKAINEVSA